MKRKPTPAIVSHKPTPAQVNAAKYVRRLHKEMDDACGIPKYIIFGSKALEPKATSAFYMPRVRISQAALRRARGNPNEVAFSDKNAFNSWIDEASLSDKDYKKMMRQMRNARHKAKVLEKRKRWITKHFGEEILAGIETIASNEVKKQVNRKQLK